MKVNISIGRLFPLLVLVAAIVLSAGLFLAKEHIRIQTAEITSLRERVMNLETVINQGVKFEVQAEEKPKLSAERI